MAAAVGILTRVPANWGRRVILGLSSSTVPKQGGVPAHQLTDPPTRGPSSSRGSGLVIGICVMNYACKGLSRLPSPMAAVTPSFVYPYLLSQTPAAGVTHSLLKLFLTQGKACEVDPSLRYQLGLGILTRRPPPLTIIQ